MPNFTHKASGDQTIAFPDVCKVPAPPAPFAPVPYSASQYQENLSEANAVDAKASAGDEQAKKQQQEAIDNLKRALGDEAGTLKGVTSATQATKMGYVLHQGAVGVPRSGKVTSMAMGLAHNRAGPGASRASRPRRSR